MKVKDIGLKMKSERRTHPYRGRSRLKLSKNLLEMKFMKKTKESQEVAEEREEYEEMFQSCQSVVESGVQVNYLRDIVSFEPLLFPRRSYGGFNEGVERLMTEHDSENDVTTRTAPLTPKDEVSVDDVSMARCLAGPGRTIGRKFTAKRQQGELPDDQSVVASSPVVKRVKQFLSPVQ